MELKLLSLLLTLAYWIMQSGGSPCTLMATATTTARNVEKIQLQLKCGSLTCRSSSFRCISGNIYEELTISTTCTGKNCTKTYNLCEAPQDICMVAEEVKNERVTTTVQPSPTLTLSECTSVTTTANKTKTLNRRSYSTQIKITTEITDSSPTLQCNVITSTETVLAAVITKTIVSVSTALCSRTVSEDGMQEQNESEGSPNQLSPALGTLLGLVVVVLAVVITGWVWTCWLLKKSGGMKITSEKQGRSFRNPMYTEVSGTQQPSNGDRCQQFDETGVPTYATVSKPSNRGTEGNKYSHGSTNAKTVVGSNSQVHHHQHGLQDAENNYHLLGKEDSSKYNVNERPAETNDDYADPDEEGEGWGQEENVYHMLEGPATEGEGPLQDEATVYEVPVPSRPPKHN